MAVERLMPKKRWESWVVYEVRGRVVKERMLRRYWFRWRAVACTEGVTDSPQVLACVLSAAKANGYFTWPRIEIRKAE